MKLSGICIHMNLENISVQILLLSNVLYKDKNIFYKNTPNTSLRHIQYEGQNLIFMIL